MSYNKKLVVLYLVCCFVIGLLFSVPIGLADDNPNDNDNDNNTGGIEYIENGWIETTNISHESLLTDHASHSFDKQSNQLSFSKKPTFDSYASTKSYDTSKIPVRYYLKEFDEETGEENLVLQEKYNTFIDMSVDSEKAYGLRSFDNNGKYVVKIGFGTISYSGVSDTITITGGSSGTPITMQDVYDEDITNSWNQVKKYNESTFHLDCKLYVGNGSSDHYFLIDDEIVVFNDNGYDGSEEIIELYGTDSYDLTVEIKNSIVLFDYEEGYTRLIEINKETCIITNSKISSLHDYSQIRAINGDGIFIIDESLFVNVFIYRAENSNCYVNNSVFVDGYAALNQCHSLYFNNNVVKNKVVGLAGLKTGTISNVSFEDCTWDASFDYDYASPTLHNVQTDRTNNDLRVRYIDTGEINRTNSLILKTIGNANIVIENRTGAVVSNGTSDSNGWYNDTLLVATYKSSFGDGTKYLAQTPFTLVINKSGYVNYTSTFNNSFQPMDYVINLTSLDSFTITNVEERIISFKENSDMSIGFGQELISLILLGISWFFILKSKKEMYIIIGMLFSIAISLYMFNTFEAFHFSLWIIFNFVISLIGGYYRFKK